MTSPAQDALWSSVSAMLAAAVSRAYCAYDKEERIAVRAV